MNHFLEPDPEEAAHDGRCPVCGSQNIVFEKELGIYAATGVYAGKPYQRIQKALWRCDECDRLFACNHFITF